MKTHLLSSIKIAITAFLAIFIAGELGLENSQTAGIITVLSIRGTKKETLQSAVRRGMAYVCALGLAAVCFHLIGFTLPGFAVYLLLFAFVCMAAGWQEAIATDSVLVTHFLGVGNMGLPILLNETLLLIIGAGLGILVNLHLHRKEEDFVKLADEVDRQIKEILCWMSISVSMERPASLTEAGRSGGERGRSDRTQDGHSGKTEDECPGKSDDERFDRLEESIRQAKLCAVANRNNSFFNKDTYELDYMRMRARQSVLLKGICQNIRSMKYPPKQAEAVAKLISQMEQAYHKENTGQKLREKLQILQNEMKQEALPQSREEFEARAILFYILMQLEELIAIKLHFMEVRGRRQKREIKSD